MTERTTQERLADLEARVAELEQQADRPGAGGEGPGGTFFALDALKQHATEAGGVVFAGVVPQGDSQVEWQYGRPVDAIDAADWSVLAQTIDALAHPVRLNLLHAVWSGTSTVAGLAELSEFGTTGQIYHHVNLLASAGWLTTVKRGHYAVPAERVVPLLVMLTAAGGPGGGPP